MNFDFFSFSLFLATNSNYTTLKAEYDTLMDNLEIHQHWENGISSHQEALCSKIREKDREINDILVDALYRYLMHKPEAERMVFINQLPVEIRSLYSLYT
jgi:hypothetical protein